MKMKILRSMVIVILVVMVVGIGVAAQAPQVAAAENSEVLFRASVAVAVMYVSPSPGNAPTKVNTARPAAFVLTCSEPSNTLPDDPLVLLAKN